MLQRVILLKNFIQTSNKYFSSKLNTGEGVIIYVSWVNVVIGTIAIAQGFSPCDLLQFCAFSWLVILYLFSS
jgi:hypothetical protein